MQIVPGVDIPNELLQAARSKNLVLFIGAGVSYNAPSNLPLFDGLVRQVAERLGEEYIETESPDSHLGDIESRQPSAKQVVHSVISDRDSLPNSTHRAIARLASATGRRIVSTNYDEHVNTAATEEGIDLGRQYSAPALPLGRDFEGVIYLHGSVSERPETLVVTDQDFGRAYLTDGWARRFAHDLFMNWTVLFVGYSHSDVVMTYLARGLPSGAKRYVLTDEPAHRRWKQLSITPIAYPSADDHKALTDTLDIWAGLMRMGQLDHYSRVKELVSGAPPKEPENIDYLIDAVATPAGATAFVSVARDYEWLRWAETQQAFKGLFRKEEREADTSKIWIDWFVTHFVSDPEHSALGLGTFARLGPGMSPKLIWAINQAQGALHAASPSAARRWNAVLTAGVHDADSSGELLRYEAYLNPYKGPELLPALRRALTPRLLLSESSNWLSPLLGGDEGTAIEPRGVSASIGWPIAEGGLKELWDRVATDLNSVAADALQIAEQGLKDAYGLLKAFSPDRLFDSWSFRRSAIEPHEQDEFPGDEDVLIDILRDCAPLTPSNAYSLARVWVLSELPVFKRVGVHLLTEELSSSEERLSCVLESGLLFDYDAKHEVFRFLEVVVPDLTADGRARALAAINAGPPQGLENVNKEGRFHRRAVFDRLEWLQRFVEGWNELDGSIETLRRIEPDMGVRPHPDIDFWIESGAWGGRPSVSADDLISIVEAEGPWKAIRNIVARDYSEREFNEPTWEDAIGLIREAVATKPAIGLDLLPVMKITPLARHRDLSSALVYGWADATLDDEQERRILSLLLEEAPNADMARPIGTYIREAVKDAETPPPQEALTRLDALAQYLWEQHAIGFAETSWSNVSMLGLNTWPGYLAQYWVNRISWRWQLEREQWTGLNSVEKAALTSMLPSQKLSEASRAALSVLATQYSFLFSADPQFALDQLSSIFDVVLSDFAPDAWFCFLHHPRVPPSLLDSGFWKQLRDAESVVGVNNEHSEHLYWRLLASIAVFSTASSVDRDTLIEDLTIRSRPQALSQFLRALGMLLRKEKPQLVDEVWKNWLGCAMTRRFAGPPEVLSLTERAAWGDLALELGFLPAIDVSMRAPGPITEKTRFRHLSDDFAQTNAALLISVAKDRLKVTDDVGWHAENTLSRLVDRTDQFIEPGALKELLEVALSKNLTSALLWSKRLDQP